MRKMNNKKAIMLSEVQDLAKRFDCYGDVPDEPVLPALKASLSREVYANVGVMMGDEKGTASYLALGVDPDDLKAKAEIYDHKTIQKMLEKEKPTTRKSPRQ